MSDVLAKLLDHIKDPLAPCDLWLKDLRSLAKTVDHQYPHPEALGELMEHLDNAEVCAHWKATLQELLARVRGEVGHD